MQSVKAGRGIHPTAFVDYELWC